MNSGKQTCNLVSCRQVELISAVVKNENDPVVAYNEQHADDPKQFEIRVSIFGKKNG